MLRYYFSVLKISHVIIYINTINFTLRNIQSEPNFISNSPICCILIQFVSFGLFKMITKKEREPIQKEIDKKIATFMAQIHVIIQFTQISIVFLQQYKRGRRTKAVQFSFPTGSWLLMTRCLTLYANSHRYVTQIENCTRKSYLYVQQLRLAC